MEPRKSAGSTSQQISIELNEPQPPPNRWRGVAVAVGRLAAWAVLAPPRRGLQAWSRLRPAQQLVLGFASYVLIGTLLLSLPLAQARPTALIDNLFNVTSAVSTTGLTTVSVSDSYSWVGEFVILCLFQLGGIGYMTLSSVVVLARGRPLSETREGVLRAGFAVPHYFVMQKFIVHVVAFTLIVEAVGALVLWTRFAALGVDGALWSAVFHSVSAFATAGFSLNNDSLERFRDDAIVNGTIAALCYLGAIGFIVVQDVWYSIKYREHMITFTSKTILWTTLAIFVAGTLLLLVTEPALAELPLGERLMACAFQVMTASSTAGFNTIPIGPLSSATLLVISIAMVIGASPSGTGGGIKTTSVSAIAANLLSVLRGRDRVVLLGRELPLVRVLSAAAAATFYVALLVAGILTLCMCERAAFLPVVFEAASALGTVGLSMGITGDLSVAGKLTVIVLMFAGRCGPLTIGLALLRPDRVEAERGVDDLAV